MALTQEQIKDLLAGSRRSKTSTGRTGPLVKPFQLGPLQWSETIGHCCSVNCGSPTMIKIDGTHICYPHALQELNRIIIELCGEDNLEDCNCDTGKYSRGNLHSKNCALFPKDNVAI